MQSLRSSLNAASPNKRRLRRVSGSAVIVRFHPYLLAMILLLYYLLPLPALLILGWKYIGGGSGIENVHPATYLLIAALSFSLLIDEPFRKRFVGYIMKGRSLIFFSAVVTLTAAYDCLVHGASAAPFVDTFLTAILSMTIVSSMPAGALIFLRRLVYLFFIINISILFLELAVRKDFLATYLSEVNRTPEIFALFGPAGAIGTFDRPSAFFGSPLDAGMLLGVFTVANLISMPARFSKVAVGRLCLSVASYLAIFPTGSRASFIVTTIALGLYAIYSVIVSGGLGRISKANLTLVLLAAAAIVPLGMVLWNLGFFDPMVERFVYDNGSALSRDYALEMLGQASTSDLWFGRSVQEIFAIQQSFGVIAIEISWVNFILVGGLITTIPLFATFCTFLVRSVRLSCAPQVHFVSLVIFVVTATSNGIWSKTTVLTTSLVIAVSLLRRDLDPSMARARNARGPVLSDRALPLKDTA